MRRNGKENSNGKENEYTRISKFNKFRVYYIDIFKKIINKKCEEIQLKSIQNTLKIMDS